MNENSRHRGRTTRPADAGFQNAGFRDAGFQNAGFQGADLRVSDAERDAVVTELSEHFQAGRLDQAEFDERMAKALRARVGRDLSTLLKDLPRLRGTKPDGAVRWAGPPRLVPVLAPLLFAAFLISVFAADGGGPHRHGPPWVVFPLFWLVVITAARVGWWRRSKRAGSGAEIL